jgi:AAA15 family ATPase/GTPase
MLIEFRVSNFRSLRDEQVLTFEADPANIAEDPRLRVISCHQRPILPAAVIFGSNASGKSNMLAALAFMQHVIFNSQQPWFGAEGFPRSAFAWSSKSKDPSLFEIVFESNGKKYQYGFVVDDRSVLEEWLYGWQEGQRQPVFLRDRCQLQCDNNLITPDLVNDCPLLGSSLWISCTRGLPVPELHSVYQWFEHLFAINVDLRLANLQGLETLQSSSAADASFAFPDPGTRLWQLCMDFLRSSDLGILDIKKVVEPSKENPKGEQCRVDHYLIRHTEEEDSWLDLEQESEGTKNLIRMAAPIIKGIECGGMVVIDELNSSLHPLLGHAIVDLFNRPQSNPQGAQVLFTTHDTRLLGNFWEQPLLRRDQIWLAEKSRSGASTIYPLTDYQQQDSENIERGYLQGRYGGIPFCKNFSRDQE